MKVVVAKDDFNRASINSPVSNWAWTGAGAAYLKSNCMQFTQVSQTFAYYTGAGACGIL